MTILYLALVCFGAVSLICATAIIVLNLFDEEQD